MGLNLTLNANVSHVTSIRKVLVIPRVRKVVRGNEDKNFIFKFAFIPKLLNTDPPQPNLVGKEHICTLDLLFRLD